MFEQKIKITGTDNTMINKLVKHTRRLQNSDCKYDTTTFL